MEDKFNILKDNEIDQNEWQDFLSKSSFKTPFQNKKFYDLLNSVDGLKAIVFAVSKENKIKSLAVVTIQKEKGIIGKLSRRGIIYGGPVFGCAASAYFLMKEITQYFKKELIYIETRNFNDFSYYKGIYKRCGWKYIPWLNFNLIIENKDQVIKNISLGRLRQIKKASKSGAYWEEASSLEEVLSFYKILLSLYNEIIKKPLFPWIFFKFFFEKQVGKYLLVHYKGKVIGGIMCMFQENDVIYEFYVCGLDTEYKYQYPSIMATWAAIEYSINQHIKVFDFMGAGRPESYYGVREFKARFGGQEVNQGRFIKVYNPFLYEIGNLGIKLLKFT